MKYTKEEPAANCLLFFSSLALFAERRVVMYMCMKGTHTWQSLRKLKCFVNTHTHIYMQIHHTSGIRMCICVATKAKGNSFCHIIEKCDNGKLNRTTYAKAYLLKPSSWGYSKLVMFQKFAFNSLSPLEQQCGKTCRESFALVDIQFLPVRLIFEYYLLFNLLCKLKFYIL